MDTTTNHRNVRRLFATVAVAAALMGCGGGPAVSNPADASTDRADTVETSTAPPTAPSADPTTPSTDPTAPSTSASEVVTTLPTEPTPPAETAPAAPADDSATLRGVSLVDELVVRDAPDGAEVAVLPATTPFDTPTVVGVLDEVPGWVQILVPVRPNDLTGWVRVDDVRLEPVTTEIHIDLTDRTLDIVENGQTTGSWTVAIGRNDRPTPVGRFFVTDKLATGDPTSVWGSHAFGISAYSDVLTDFIGGNGQIGVHGTNDPSSIGNDVSSGCIRLPNEVIDDLITRVPLGTPVFIS